MKYFDQHIHCRVSPDSRAPAQTMAAAARERGMDMILFTDHVDMDDAHTGLVAPTWPAQREKMAAERAALAEAPPEGILVRWGMELGEPHHAPQLARQAAGMPGLDLVLGSLHNLRGREDFYYIPYESEAECAALDRLYIAELLELADFPDFDVMAHIGYTSRYMHLRGFQTQITPENFGPELTALFQKLIQSGRGIEVNVSGLRMGHTTYPNAPTLRLYRELGGEIITVGSDAHTPQDASGCVKEGFALLESLGFSYVAAFKERKPEFIHL